MQVVINNIVPGSSVFVASNFEAEGDRIPPTAIWFNERVQTTTIDFCLPFDEAIIRIRKAGFYPCEYLVTKIPVEEDLIYIVNAAQQTDIEYVNPTLIGPLEKSVTKLRPATKPRRW